MRPAFPDLFGRRTRFSATRLILISAAALIAAVFLSCARTDKSRRVPPSVAYESNLRAGESAPPADTLGTPLTSDPRVIKEGAKLFSAMNCDGCHGGDALGWVGPSLVDGRWRYGGGDGEIYHSIFYGRPRGMPAYGGLLSSDAIWKIITYLRAQPIPSVVPTQSWTAAAPANPASAREKAPIRK